MKRRGYNPRDSVHTSVALLTFIVALFYDGKRRRELALNFLACARGAGSRVSASYRRGRGEPDALAIRT